MRPMLIAAAIVLCAGTVRAQESDTGMGGYTSMKIERVGRFRGSFDDAMTIREMTNGVSITLMSDDPNLQPLPIRANTMRFEWKEGSETPVRIELEGNVDVQHPKGKLSAEKGVWDFEKGTLMFSGNPVLDTPRAKGVRGTKMTINFKENDLDIEDMRADESIPLRGGMDSGGSAGGAAALSEGDVKNWAGFIGALKAQAKSDGPSPGKRILGQFDKDAQSKFLGASTDLIVQKKSDLLKQLNRVLGKAGLYQEEAWKGISLDEDTKKLLASPELSAADQVRLNRALFKAAFAEFMAP